MIRCARANQAADLLQAGRKRTERGLAGCRAGWLAGAKKGALTRLFPLERTACACRRICISAAPPLPPSHLPPGQICQLSCRAATDLSRLPPTARLARFAHSCSFIIHAARRHAHSLPAARARLRPAYKSQAGHFGPLPALSESPLRAAAVALFWRISSSFAGRWRRAKNFIDRRSGANSLKTEGRPGEWRPERSGHGGAAALLDYCFL